MPEILGFIPARGGSKGLKNKNLYNLCGKPLLWYTIEAARQAKLVDKFIVSTDSDDIINYCKSQNVEFIRRPDYLATDEAIVTTAINHTLDFLNDNNSYNPDVIVNLNPTSPLRGFKYIDKALIKLLNNNYDSIFSATLYSCSEAAQYGRWKCRDSGKIESLYDPHNMKRRQDLKNSFSISENGSIYAIKADFFRKYNSLIGFNPSYILMTLEESVDINVLADLERAEFLLKELFS